jgi:hypothetical protein
MDFDNLGRLVLRRLSLPPDSRLPAVAVKRPRREALRSTVPVEFQSAYLVPQSSEEYRAWLQWCGGHHHLFLYWLFMAHSCAQANDGLSVKNPDKAAFWLERFRKLLMGSLSVMLCASDFSPELYNALIRPSMVRVREDFSGVSSKEYAELIAQFTGLRAQIKRLEEDGADSDLPDNLAQAVAATRSSWPLWFQEHHRIARRFDPEGSSLLELALKKMERAGTPVDKQKYMAEVLRSPEAREAQDLYFGVDRTCTSSDSLAATVMRSIETTRTCLATGLSPRDTAQLIEGDVVLAQIVSDRTAASAIPKAA